MKKIISLALAAGLLVGASVEAKAADVSVFGLISTVGISSQNLALTEAGAEEFDPEFWVEQRVEVGLRIKATETLSGQIRLRMPNLTTWGGVAVEQAYSPNLDTSVRVREAWIKTPIAMFDATVGYQFYGLPKIASGFNPVDAGFNPMPGIKLTADFGMVTPTFAWIALRDGYTVYATSEYDHKSNVYYATAPVALADGMKLTPWVAYNEVQGFAKPSTTSMGASFDAVINNMTAGAGAIFVMDDNEDNDTSMAVAGNFAINLGSLTPGIAVWYGMSGDVAPAYDYAGNTTGTWAGFNGSQTAFSYTQNTHNGFTVTNVHGNLGLTPFNTLAVVANLTNIKLGYAFIGADFSYLMGTDDYGTADTPSAVEAGASLYLPLSRTAHFGLNAAVAMPLAGQIKDYEFLRPTGTYSDGGLGFGGSFRLAMNF